MCACIVRMSGKGVCVCVYLWVSDCECNNCMYAGMHTHVHVHPPPYTHTHTYSTKHTHYPHTLAQQCVHQCLFSGFLKAEQCCIINWASDGKQDSAALQKHHTAHWPAQKHALGADDTAKPHLMTSTVHWPSHHYIHPFCLRTEFSIPFYNNYGPFYVLFLQIGAHSPSQSKEQNKLPWAGMHTPHMHTVNRIAWKGEISKMIWKIYIHKRKH